MKLPGWFVVLALLSHAKTVEASWRYLQLGEVDGALQTLALQLEELTRLDEAGQVDKFRAGLRKVLTPRWDDRTPDKVRATVSRHMQLKTQPDGNTKWQTIEWEPEIVVSRPLGRYPQFFPDTVRQAIRALPKRHRTAISHFLRRYKRQLNRPD